MLRRLGGRPSIRYPYMGNKENVARKLILAVTNRTRLMFRVITLVRNRVARSVTLIRLLTPRRLRRLRNRSRRLKLSRVLLAVRLQLTWNTRIRMWLLIRRLINLIANRLNIKRSTLNGSKVQVFVDSFLFTT